MKKEPKASRRTKQQVVDQWYEDNKGSIVWTKETRDNFRLTTTWKKFVKRFKKQVCEFCSCKTTTATYHHLYPESYDTLRPELFKSLCWSCHTKVSQLSRRKDRSGVPEYFVPFLENHGDPPELICDHDEGTCSKGSSGLPSKGTREDVSCLV